MAAAPARPPRVPDLSRIRREGAKLPSRIVIYGVEGVGKTSIAALAPKPVFLMGESETGLLTLMDSGCLPSTDHFPPITTWQETLDAVDDLLGTENVYRTVVMDSLGVFERLCHIPVCKAKFENDWKEFDNFGKGASAAIHEWSILLAKLDQLRSMKKMAVILLGHSKVKGFRNPLGHDYDRYEVDISRSTWGVTHKWADIVLFANYVTDTLPEDGNVKRQKGKGGTERVLYAQRTAAWDAKNRHSLPYEIPMGNSPTEAWANLVNAIKSGKESE